MYRPSFLLSLSLLVVGIFLFQISNPVNGQTVIIPASHTSTGVYIDANTRIGPPWETYRAKTLRPFQIEETASFDVTYNNFTSEQQQAFEYALHIWAVILTSNVPIHVQTGFQTYQTDPNASGIILGQSSSAYSNDFIGDRTDVIYPSALGDAIAGEETNPNEPDIVLYFNQDVNWYYETDGNPPSQSIDFVSVVLHEICHGLGINNLFTVSNSSGSYGVSRNSGFPREFWGIPTIFGTFLLNGSSQYLTDSAVFQNNSTALAAQCQSNNVYFAGSLASQMNYQTHPKIYAPSTFETGSSMVHLEEDLYAPGDINSLMTPSFNSAEANHSPGPIVIGMLMDIGWPINPSSVPALPDPPTIPLYKTGNVLAVGAWNANTNSSDLTVTAQLTDNNGTVYAQDSSEAGGWPLDTIFRWKTVRYKNGSGSELSEWRNRDFDDSDWNQADGTGFTLGYGSNGESGETSLDSTSMTVYTRSIFDCPDYESINGFELKLEGDDAVAAWINGVYIGFAGVSASTTLQSPENFLYNSYAYTASDSASSSQIANYHIGKLYTANVNLIEASTHISNWSLYDAPNSPE